MQHRQTTNTRRNVNDYLSRKAKEISPYAAGAQPKAGGVIKLNTNENPYPPSPEAMRAMADFNAAALRLYPRPDGGVFKTAAANVHNLPESYVFCGNGSDEVLGFAFDAFFDGNICFPISPTASTRYGRTFLAYHTICCRWAMILPSPSIG